jgi:hypothetical protein
MDMGDVLAEIELRICDEFSLVVGHPLRERISDVIHEAFDAGLEAAGGADGQELYGNGYTDGQADYAKGIRL